MIAYLDCVSGISGDMFLSSLIDLGFTVSELKKTISRLDVEIPDIVVAKEARHGIYGTRIKITSSHSQGRISFHSVRDLIQNSSLEPEIKGYSIRIFEIIAKAEAKIHDRPVQEVHFHEVGGLDSIVDIVGVVAGLRYLGIDSLFCSPIPLGSGTTKTVHGIIPIPSPASLQILQGVPVYGTGIEAELVTPTGAALVKGLAKGFGKFPPMVIKGAGYGVGSRDLRERPNLVRLILGDLSQDKESDTIIVLETHVDDCMPEHLGYLMNILFENGALDVAYAPIFMKKNRPGVSIKVICKPEDMEALMDAIFKETGTLGIRYSFTFRKRLKREIQYIDTPWGRVRIKRIQQVDGSTYLKPEYDDCLKIAKKYGIPLKKVYEYLLGDRK